MLAVSYTPKEAPSWCLFCCSYAVLRAQQCRPRFVADDAIYGEGAVFLDILRRRSMLEREALCVAEV